MNRDNKADRHDLNSPPSSDYVAEAQVREAKAAARAGREAEQKQRMDAAHEKAKTGRCLHGHDDPPRGHVCPKCGKEPQS